MTFAGGNKADGKHYWLTPLPQVPLQRWDPDQGEVNLRAKSASSRGKAAVTAVGLAVVLAAVAGRAQAQAPGSAPAENAGLEGSVVVNKVKTLKAGEGLNADTGEYENLIKVGIIDPAMVTRSALQNAASIAKNILTTECIVADKPEPAGAGGMGGMGGGMPPGMM